MIKEFFKRLRLVITILRHGDLVNGNLKHLRAMMAELDFISTHSGDLAKDEIINLILGDADKPTTGMRHHLSHVLTSQNWRILWAQMVDSELMDAKKRVMSCLDELRGK